MKMLVHKNKIAFTLIVSILLLLSPLFTQAAYADEMTERPVIVLPSKTTMTNIQDYINPAGYGEVNSAKKEGTSSYNIAGSGSADGGFIRTPDGTVYNLLSNDLEYVFNIKTPANETSNPFNTYNDYGIAFAFYYQEPAPATQWTVNANSDYERLGLYGVSGESGTHIPNAIAVEFDNQKNVTNTTAQESNIDAGATNIAADASHIAITRPRTTTASETLTHWAASQLSTPYANNTTNTARITWKLVNPGATAELTDNVYRLSYYYFQGATDAAGTPTVSGFHDFTYNDLLTYFVKPAEVRIAITGSGAFYMNKDQIVTFVPVYDYTVTYCAADKDGNAITRGTETCVPVPGLTNKTGSAPAGPTDIGPFPATPAGFTLKPAQSREKTVTTNAAANVYKIYYIDSQAPSITPINALSVPEDKAITDITVTSSDTFSTGTYLTTTVTGLPVGLNYNPTSKLISGTPSQPGVYTVIITATDEAKNVSTSQFSLTVTDTTAPAISAITSLTVSEDLPITKIDITVTDNYDPNPSVTVDGLPAGLSYDSVQKAIVGTPTTPGLSTVTITAKDAANNSSTAQIAITVLDKTGPVIDPVSDKTYPADQEITAFTVTATDLYSPPATVSLSGLPLGLSATGGSVSGTPTEIGVFTVAITASDSAGNSSSGSFKITVADTGAPVIDPIGDKLYKLGSQITAITLSASDAYSEPVSFTVTGLPAGLSFSGNQITGTPTAEGVFTVSVTARDTAGNEAPLSFKITVDGTAPAQPAINLPKVGDTSLSGTGEAGAQVVISLPGGGTQTVTVGPDGTWTSDPIPALAAGDTVSAYSQDAAGNTSATTSANVDGTAPEITAPSATSFEFAGGQPISAITITATDNSGQTPTVTLSALPAGLRYENGAIVGTPTALGNTVVTITATDASGNFVTKQISVLVSDQAAPVISAPATGGSYTWPEDQPITPIPVTITDDFDASPTLTATGLPDGLSILNGEIQGTPSTPGTYNVSLTAKDAAGNTSAAVSLSITVTDETAPSITQVTDLLVDEDSTISPITLTITEDYSKPVTTTVTGLPDGLSFDSASLSISGTPGTPGEYTVIVEAKDSSDNLSSMSFKITVRDGTDPIITGVDPQYYQPNKPILDIPIVVTDNGPMASVEVTNLPAGLTYSDGVIKGTPITEEERTVLVTATDAAGNVSTMSFTIKVDGTAPATPTIDLPHANDTTISGTAEPGSTVTINLPGGVTETVTADEKGIWTLTPIAPLKDADTITVVSQDASGNTSDPASATVDGQAPNAPVIAPVQAGATSINGQAEPNSSVTIIWPGGQSETVMADANGDWSANVPVGFTLTDGQEISATAKDASGNKSNPGTVIVDGIAPADPGINLPHAGDTALSGTGEPGSTIIITLPGGTTETVMVNPQGTWSLEPIPALQDKDVISVVSKDPAGNSSSTVTATVDGVAPDAPIINPVKADAPSISGTAEANSKVTITWPNGDITETTANGQGVWTATPRAPLKDTEIISATVTDAAGNVSQRGTTIVDGSAPAAPVISAVAANHTDLSGLGEPGATVSVTWPDGTVTENIPVDSTGKWNIAIPADNLPLQDGQTIQAAQSDAAGNTSPKASILVDGIAPNAPAIAPVAAGADTVSGTAEANAKVVVTWPDGTSTETTADAAGVWSVTAPAGLSDGQNISATAEDAAGNTSAPATIKVDGTAPAAPAIAPVAANAGTVTGTAEANATITVTWPDTKTTTTTADSNGNWSVPAPAGLADGQEISATATDAAGNESLPGSTLVDGVAPSIPTLNLPHAGDTSLGGNGEPGSTIVITLPGGTSETVTVGPDGTWTYEPIPPLTDGDVISIISQDPAGNKSDSVSATVDGIAPDAPVIAPVAANATKVNGRSEPNATITITWPDTTTSTVKADANGDWSATPPAGLQHGQTITATAKDASGNISGPGSTTVDGLPPQLPTITLPKVEETSLGGTGEPGSQIIVTLPDGTTQTTTVGPDGNWTLESIPALKDKDVVSIISKDAAGNSSGPVSVTIDSLAPNAPTIAPVKAGASSVSGTAEANALITVTWPDGTSTTTTADSSGNWTLPAPAGLSDAQKISAVAADASGNKSQPGEATVDGQAPDAPVITMPKVGDESISGSAEPGATIEITLPDGNKATVQVNEQGTWVYTPVAPIQHGDVISAIATDTAGNASTSTTLTVDGLAPDAPVIAPVAAGVRSISGTAEPNTSLTVIWPGGQTTTVLVDAKGGWTAPVPELVNLADGQTITATAKDAAGNISAPGIANVDGIAPSQPGLTLPKLNDTTLGGTGDPGTQVEITLPDGTHVYADVLEDGTWSYGPIAPLQDGNTVTVVGVDPAGNKSEPVTATVDGLAPAAPVIAPVKANAASVAGTAEPNAKILVTWPNGVTSETQADAQGNWTLPAPAGLSDGQVISATAKDAAGNTSLPGSTTVDGTPPVITLSVVGGNYSFPEDLPITPIGVVANDNSGAVHSIIVSGLPAGLTYINGKIEGTVADPGSYPVTVTAMDAAGNQATVTINLLITDTTAPVFTQPVQRTYTYDEDAPIPQAIQIAAQDNSGKAPVVTVSDLPDGLFFDPTTGKIVGTPTLPGTFTVYVTAVDQAGNNTEIELKISINHVSPPAPVIYAPLAGATSISGQGIPGQTIYVTLPDGSVVSTVVDAQGNWQITGISPLAANALIKAVQEDADQDRSPEASVTVQSKVRMGIYLPLIQR